MIENLVVIASNNGASLLPRCLQSLGDRHKRLVVDTGSTDPDSQKYVQRRINANKAAKIGSSVMFEQLPFKGYTTGAYLWAYWHYKAEHYFFMQDSMELTEDTDDFLRDFKNALPERGAAAWATFKEDFDTPEQKQWAHYILNSDPDDHPNNTVYPERGIFGPVFYVSRKTLDELNDRGLLPPTPTTKYQAQGMERVWPWLFHKAGMEVASVGGEWDAGKMERGEFGIFRKQFADRK